jgi:hypothetical protein
VSVWALHGYLSETCEEAKGEKSAAFFSVTIAKALDQMKQTEMVERRATGLRLTEHGRWDLLKRGVTKFPAGSLLEKNEAKLSGLGVSLRAPELLMEMEELKWSMGEFLKKAADFAPTLVLIKMKNGTECGGVAGVPWPKEGATAADPAKGSFIFSLGATPARFDLVDPVNAVFCTTWGFGFGYSCDLFVCSDGRGCGSCGQRHYAGPHEKGQLIGATPEAHRQPYERWELWRL